MKKRNSLDPDLKYFHTTFFGRDKECHHCDGHPGCDSSCDKSCDKCDKDDGWPGCNDCSCLADNGSGCDKGGDDGWPGCNDCSCLADNGSGCDKDDGGWPGCNDCSCLADNGSKQGNDKGDGPHSRGGLTSERSFDGASRDRNGCDTKIESSTNNNVGLRDFSAIDNISNDFLGRMIERDFGYSKTLDVGSGILDKYTRDTARDLTSNSTKGCSDMDLDGVDDTALGSKVLAKVGKTYTFSMPNNPALGIKVTYDDFQTSYEVFDRATGRVLGGAAGYDERSYKSFGTERQIDLGNKSTYDINKTFTSYREVNGQLDFSKIESQFKSELTDPRTGFSAQTTYKEDKWYGSKVSISKLGTRGINVEEKTINTRLGSFSWDTHYWGTATGAIEFGLAAEIAMDVLETLNVDFEVSKNLALVTEVVATIALQIMPAIQQIKAGIMIGKYINSFYGGVTAISGLINTMSGLTRLSEILGSQTHIGGISLSELEDRRFGGGNDLSRIDTNTLIEYNSSPIGLEMSFNRSNSLLPVSNQLVSSQFKKVVPEIQDRGDTMESNMPVDMIGMNNIREGHLLNSNEAQLAINTSFDRGIIESVTAPKMHIHQNLQGIDYVYMYSDDNHSGTRNYTKSDGVSFAKLANNTYATYQGKVYQIETKSSSNALLQHALLPLSLDKGSLGIKAETIVPDSVWELLRAQISSATVTAESIRKTENKTGVVPGYEARTAAFDGQDYFTIFKNALLTGVRQVTVGGTSNGIHGSRVSIKFGAYNTVATIGSGVWKAEIDVLQAFGKLFNKFTNDELSYAATVYEETTGKESDPVKTSYIVGYSNEIKLVLTGIPAGKKVKIYRKSPSSTLYKYIGMTSETIFIDTLTDIPNAQYLEFYKNEIIEGLKGLIEHKATLFAYKGSYVYFTRPGRPNTWNELQNMTINEDITGLASTPLGLLVFSKFTTYLLGGTDKFNYSLSNVSQSIGCDTGLSIQNIKNAVIWVFNNDIMVSLGSAITNITRNRLKLPKAKIVNSCVVGDIYYLAFDNGDMLKLDFRNPQPIVTRESIHGKSITTDGVNLYIVSNDGVYIRYGVESDDNLTLNTPKFVGNALDATKEFHSVNITAKGTFNIDIYINDKKIRTYPIDSDIQTVHSLGIPADFNEGLHIYLGIFGKGKIYGYRYIFDYLNMK